MITLYGFGRVFPKVIGETKDLRVQWALEEMGLPYQVHGLDHTGGEHLKPSYAEICPFQRVPAIDDDGFAVAESGAILLYLAEKYRALGPSDFQERTRVQQWCFSILNTVEQPMEQLLSLHIFGGDNDRHAGLMKEAARPLMTLERELSHRKWIVGAEFTVADILLTSVLRMIRHTQLLQNYPNVNSYYTRSCARPAWQRTLNSYAKRLGVNAADIA